MATLYITEFSNLGLNELAPIAQEPAIGSATVTFTTAAQSAVFDEKTRYVKLHSTAECRVLFGSNPTAVAASEFLVAGVDHWRGVKPGQRLSVYDGSS